ncbi:MAG: tetratricopeptide repeat protein [Niastella sp.]|nr:tetratricopeptide repeat protein [Niastella sp.]
MEYFPFIMLGLCILVITTRPLTVLLHELGHAIPAILLTRQRTTIYIGSYGDPKNSVRFRVGLLEVYLRYNPFLWMKGLCAPSAESISVNRQIVYTVTGPIASFVIASIACYITFTYDMHGALKLYVVIFLGSALFDLFFNLIPNSHPIRLFDGRIVYNDGYQLQQLLRYKRFPRSYDNVLKQHGAQRFAESAKVLEKMLADGIVNDSVFQLAINAYLNLGNYKRVKELGERFAQRAEQTPLDLFSLGTAYSRLNMHEAALELYDKALQQDPDHIYSLSDKAYTLNLLNRFEEAIQLFDRIIVLEENSGAYAYSNRGLSRIKLGQTEEGLQDINRAFELGKDNGYAYRNLGIYHLDKGDYEEALQLFIKAKEAEGNVHLIDKLIEQAKRGAAQ